MIKNVDGLIVGAGIVFFSLTAAAGPVIFSASGADPAGIQDSVDSFRAALGTLNPNVAGSFGSGRREINWDGVPDSFAAPNNLPANFYNVNSPRGTVFTTPGNGFQVSANAGVAPIEFGNINPTYPDLFAPFSPQRLFTPLGSNIVDVNFFIPGTTTLALTSAFGAVFSDVDVDVRFITSLTFFDASNISLGTFAVPNFPGRQSLSFLGVDFGSNLVSRVRIVNGNTALSKPETEGVDLVVMDDFIYGEPVSARQVPEPATLLLLSAGLALLSVNRREA